METLVLNAAKSRPRFMKKGRKKTKFVPELPDYSSPSPSFDPEFDIKVAADLPKPPIIEPIPETKDSPRHEKRISVLDEEPEADPHSEYN